MINNRFNVVYHLLVFVINLFYNIKIKIMNNPLFLPYEASIDVMTDNELVVWLYQEKIIIKRYNVPKYQWEEIEKLYKNSKQK